MRRNRGGLARSAVVGCCRLFGAGGAAWLAFGLLWRHDPADTGAIDGWVAFAALCAQTFALHLGIAAFAVGLIALALRARHTALFLVLVGTAGSAGWMASWLPRGGSAAPDAPGLTVFSANLLYRNGVSEGLLEQIDAADPDVVLFQEYAPTGSGYEARLASRYPYRLVLPRSHAFGQAVFSRLPFATEPAVLFGPDGRIPMIVCEVEAHGRRVGVWNVHTLPPTGAWNTLSQRAMVAWIGGRAASVMDGPDAPDGLIVAGDFNAPFRTNHLRELRRAGLREAHGVAGRGPGATWPRLWWKRHAPGIRLDHVAFGGGLRAAWARVGSDFGSDHRPVLARLVFGAD